MGVQEGGKQRERGQEGTHQPVSGVPVAAVKTVLDSRLSCRHQPNGRDRPLSKRTVLSPCADQMHAVLHPPVLQLEISESLAAEMEAVALGTAVDPRDVDAIVKDLLASDEDLEEAELPIFARRNPVVAAAAVSGAQQMRSSS